MDIRNIFFMSLDTAEKQSLIKTHQVHPTDTGSVEVQVAMLSKRISKLSDHLQGNIHDFASRQGLLKMIGKRKRLLSYIKDKNIQKYQDLVKKINFMSLDTAEKQKLIETHQVHATDTGSVEVQVAMLSKRISKLANAVFSE